MNKLRTRRIMAVVWMTIMTGTIGAQNFLNVKQYTCRRQGEGVSVSMKADFPVEGNAALLKSVRQWICETLDVDAPKTFTPDRFPELMQQSCDRYLQEPGKSSHTIEITWSFEDPECVTFESTIMDKDSVTWTTEDCATFSKKDGHRITASEIFKCDKRQIKQLMWQFRGSLIMEVPTAAQLYVGNVGLIDGWVIVIGPAVRHSGAEYRIRYEIAEPYLRTSKGGDYYSDGPDKE